MAGSGKRFIILTETGRQPAFISLGLMPAEKPFRKDSWFPENKTDNHSNRGQPMKKFLKVFVFSVCAFFSLQSPQILWAADSFQQPEPGAVVLVNDTVTLQWTAESFQEAVIDYSKDSGTTWEVVTDSGISPQEDQWGNFKWVVPDITPASEGTKIRIRDKQGTGILETGLITVTGLQILNPLGGETFYAGDTVQIQWSTKKYDDMVLDYSANNGKNWKLIKDDGGIFEWDKEWGSYPWVVPDTTCDQCMIAFHRYFAPDEVFKTGKFAIEKSSSAARQPLPFQVKYEKRSLSAFPNPFRGEVQFIWRGLEPIDFKQTAIQIIDSRGKKVARIDRKNPSWDGRNFLGKKMATGRYFYRVQGPSGKGFSGTIIKN